METLYELHAYLIGHLDVQFKREAIEEIDWNERLIFIGLKNKIPLWLFGFLGKA